MAEPEAEKRRDRGGPYGVWSTRRDNGARNTFMVVSFGRGSCSGARAVVAGAVWGRWSLLSSPKIITNREERTRKGACVN